jgi:sugar phosphate isomerase/epimerase
MATSRRPADLAAPDLVWSHFSRPRYGAFDERVDAAAEAGFSGIGLYVNEYRRLRNEEGRSGADIARRLDEAGLCIGELEAIAGWWAADGDVHDACEASLALAFEMADTIGARYLQVIGPYDCELSVAVDRFGALCDRGARYELLVGIEWLPYTNIATADEVRAVVDAVGRPNAGYCADIWHHVRGANDEAMLRRLDGSRIFSVQMNDGPLRATLDDYKADCLANRVPPGEGEFDCVGFVRILQELGVSAPWSLEVASTELWALPAREAARRAADGMRRILAEVG